MGYSILFFVAIFLLIGSVGVLLFYRESHLRRISAAINQQQEEKSLKSVVQQAGTSIGNMMVMFESLVPKSEQEKSAVKERLARAGYRDESAVKIYYGTQVAVPLVLVVVTLVTGLGSMSAFLYVIAAILGFMLPSMWLGKMTTLRQKKIARALPDVLDLLVICMEAGLSLDQATSRTSQELTGTHPALCQEMNILVLEQRAGVSRSECWKHMAERTGVDSIQSLTSTLVQAEQFGTSVAKVLRVHSETLRTQRVQMIEELAAKTSVKLVFPLVLFIFPALFLVTLGPAAIVMVESFNNLNK
jgi:tight adherence protein C